MSDQPPDPNAEPPPVIPQFYGTTISSMCHLMARPIVMTGFLRDWLIRKFQAGNIEEPALRHLIWRNNLATNILIESNHRWRPQLTQLRPAIILKRNTYSNQRIGFGDRQQGNPVDRAGNPHFATMWVGSHTLFCIGGSGAQAELLGTEVQREFTQFAMLVLGAMGLHRFQVMEVGEVAKLAEAPDNFVVPVSVSYGFEERWVIMQQAPKLSAVSLSMILEC